MVLSPGKHYHAQLGGFYCERVIVNLPDTFFVSADCYGESALADSLKVRLLSPETKDREAAEETNPAIGKGRLLFKQLEWSPPGWEKTLSVIAQRRFYGRFRGYLPLKPNGDFVRSIELPSQLGGLGFVPPRIAGWDVENVLEDLSPPHLRALTYLARGGAQTDLVLKALGKFSSDRYARGIRLDDGIQLIIDHLWEFLPTYSFAKAKEEVRTQYNVRTSLGFREVSKLIKKLGYHDKQSLKRLIEKATTQSELLHSAPGRGFKSASWEQRFVSLEADLILVLLLIEDQDVTDYDTQVIYDWIKSFSHPMGWVRSLQTRSTYLHVSTSHIWDEDMQEPIPILKELRKGLPNLSIPSIEGILEVPRQHIT
jgi:hypothetical protein